MWLTLLTSLLLAPASTLSPPLPDHQDPCSPGLPEYGPSFVIPFELAQGVTLGRGSPEPYAASLRVHPTYILDRRRQLRLAGQVGLALVNPSLEALLGGRISKSVFEVNLGPVRGVGAHLGLEALYGTSGRTLLGAVLIADGGGLFQGTLRGNRDVTHGTTLLELGLGVHLYNGPTPDPTREVPSPPPSYLGRVEQDMSIAMNAAIGTVREQDIGACQRLIADARRLVQRRSPRVRTVAEFRNELTAQRLGSVASLMTDPDPPPPGISEAQVVLALYRGMGKVVGVGITP